MKTFFRIIPLLLLLQTATAQKTVTHNTFSWVSINSNLFVSEHWYIMADVHLRENDFFASNSFLFGRIGLGYQVDDHLSFTAGYGNLLSSPAKTSWSTKADEERIFQQVQFNSSYKKLKILQRLRNEQRWQDIVVNDQKSGTRFTNRLRYLLSGTLPVFKNPMLPQLVVADELMLQFGKAVTYNTFEQNRLFFGIKQKINNRLSFDAGYMQIFQQKADGKTYSMSDTYRLFFYYTLPPKKRK